ncbi:MAG: hypothetical protein QXX08_03910 [Candidatus Bathyarchaeia archaeon]
MEFKAREEKIVVLAHCVLNQSTRWWQNEKKPRAKGPVMEVLEALSKLNIGAVQLPCPEFTFCGNPRPPRTKDEYERLPGFRLHCEDLAKASAKNLKTLTDMGRKPKVHILAVVGVTHSPTCGVKCTPRMLDGKVEYIDEKGLFIEILEREMEKLGLRTAFIEFDFHTPENLCENLYKIMK